MKSRFSSYPIGKLFIDTFHNSGLSLPEFARALGYSNTNKGIATLDCWLRNGTGNQLFLERLTSSRFAPEPGALRTAMRETGALLAEERRTEKQQRVEAERAAFRPFVQGVAELSRPTSITMFAVTGGPARYTVPLPTDIAEWSADRRDEFLRETIKENFARNRGRTLFMGQITGYLFFREYGARPVSFSVDGLSRGEVDASPAGEAKLTINGRTIPHGFFAVQSLRP